MSAFENQSTETLRARIEALMGADAPSDAESAELLAIVDELKRRGDADYLRVDAEAALGRFRETYLPTVESRPRRLPAFLAAFAGGKSPTPQEEDDLRRMIEDFRKEGS